MSNLRFSSCSSCATRRRRERRTDFAGLINGAATIDEGELMAASMFNAVRANSLQFVIAEIPYRLRSDIRY